MRQRFSPGALRLVGGADKVGEKSGGPPGQSLAHRGDFQLAAATVRPSLRAIRGPGGTVSIEPRVMRVLLALADADGTVLSRDDLIHRCWDDVIVGDDAVNRAISELRRISRSVDGRFRVETIPRVGYRLVNLPGNGAAFLPDDAGASAKQSLEPSRRLVIGGGIAALAIGSGAWLALRPTDNLQATALVLRGEQALRDGLPNSAEQGIGFLREAVSIDPANARAWGLLALGLRNVVEYARPEDSAAAINGCERAFGKALAIDSAEPNALAARATLRPDFGEWFQAEQRLRAVLAVAPDHAWSLAALGYLMESVGRSRESAKLTSRAAAIEPLSPVFQYRLAYKHWILGQATLADQVIERALQLWPRHPAVVFARFLLFVWTGRYGSATTMLADKDVMGTVMPVHAARTWEATIEALRGRRPRDIARVRQKHLDAAVASPGNAVLAMQMLSLLGEIDAVFEIANGYLLRSGNAIGKLRQAEGQVSVNDKRRRSTVMLFTPNTSAMRADPRFMPLVNEIGLVRYWQTKGVRPDFLIR